MGAWGGDMTLLLTLKAEVRHAPVKNELRLGLWQKGKDGLDPLDVQAMVNGSFDAWLEISSANGKSNHKLWWDIRSLNPPQEWTLHINAPSGLPVTLEWKQLSAETKPEQVRFILSDPETGHETELTPPGGSVQISTQGTKTLTLKSFQK